MKYNGQYLRCGGGCEGRLRNEAGGGCEGTRKTAILLAVGLLILFFASAQVQAGGGAGNGMDANTELDGGGAGNGGDLDEIDGGGAGNGGDIHTTDGGGCGNG